MLPEKSLRKKSPCLINHNQLKLKLTDTKNVSYNINTFIHLRIAPLCRCARQKHFSSNWHNFSLTLFTCFYSALQKVRRFLRPSRKGKFLSAWLISPKPLDTGATVTNLTDERLVSKETTFSCH